jgi:hypothetical protein
VFLAWVAFPLVLFAIAVGCGLLVRAAFNDLPGAITPVAGLAVIVVVGQVTTLVDATAELTTPLVVVLAVAGYGLSMGSLERPSVWAVACAVAVFAFYAAPIVLSGEATFAGFVKLDDTATWMALTDRIMEHGRSLSGLEPSTYEATLAFNLGHGYPIGAFLPLGVARELVGQDVAWVIQPYMACLGAMLGLALWELLRGLVPSPGLRALAATLAAQPALLYGYYLWGGVKEMTAAALIAGAAACVGWLVSRPRDAGPIVTLALLSGASIGVLSGGGVVWLLPALLAAVAASIWAVGRVVSVRRALGFAAAVVLLSLPVIVPGGLLPPTSSPIDSATALGNLISPLPLREVAGIWPAGDFRLSPDDGATTGVLIAVSVIAAAWAFVWAWRDRAWGFMIYVAGALVSALVIFELGSPWVAAKALATASPAIPFAAAAAGALLASRGRRVEGSVLIAVIAGGVLWSNALAYRDVNLAPRGQLGELQAIGEQIAGEGPTLMTEYNPYGARHFLRDADPEGASELRRRVVPLVNGGQLTKGESADTDRFQLQALLAYRTLVLRRSPAQSRPPSPYHLIYRGTYYEAWQRPARAPAELIDPLGPGSPLDPTAIPRCPEVRRLAQEAGHGGTLAVVKRPAPLALGLSRTRHPPGWPTARSDSLPSISAGTISASVTVPTTSGYEVWLGGSVRPQVDLLVDGRRVGSVRHELNNAGQYVLLGQVPLSAGHHRLEIAVHGADLHPGSGGRPAPIGPLVLSSDDAAQTQIRRFPAKDAREVCAGRWDWVEAFR